MLNEIQLFHNEEFGDIRVVVKDGEPWFVAKDVCSVLGLEQVSRAMDRLDEEERGLLKVTHPQNTSKTIAVNGVNESGLYHLVLCSTKSEAKSFRRWVTSDVLPSIRKHGAYMTPQALMDALTTPEAMIQLFTRLKEEQDKGRTLETENALLAQQVLRWDDTAFLNAAVRKFSQSLHPRYGDQFTFGWNLFKKELIYRHGINLNMRKTEHLNRTGKKTPPKTLSLLSEDELPLAVSTIVAMCRESGVDISDLLANIELDEAVS